MSTTAGTQTVPDTHGEPDVLQLLDVEDHTTIEDERRLRHLVIHRLPVNLLERLPLRRDHNGLLLLARLECSVNNCHVLLDILKRRRWAGLLQVLPDLRLLDLRVVDCHVRALRKEVTDESDGSRLAGVAGVRLEGEAENGDVLDYPESAVRDWHVDVSTHTLPVIVLKSVSTTVFEKRAF